MRRRNKYQKKIEETLVFLYNSLVQQETSKPDKKEKSSFLVAPGLLNRIFTSSPCSFFSSFLTMAWWTNKAPWHGGPIRPSGLLKASLTESNRQKMNQTVESNINHMIYVVNRVSKPSYLPHFSTSQLLFFVSLRVTSWLIKIGPTSSCPFVALKNRRNHVGIN